MTPLQHGVASRGRSVIPVPALLLLGLCGCASLRASADQGLRPGPHPVVGMAVGAGVNSGMLLLHRPWWQRLTAQLLVGGLKRFTPWFGPKWEGWHIEVLGGGVGAEWASWMGCRGPCDRHWR